MIYLGLGISIILNILLSWFCYKVVRKFLNHSENIYFLMDRMDDFTAHLSAIYELEMFYGDETLHHLLEHSVSLSEHMLTFEEIYSLTEEKPLDQKRQIEDPIAEENPPTIA